MKAFEIILLLGLSLLAASCSAFQQSFAVPHFDCQKLETVCNSLEGTPYVWGGSSPNPGFDCSGAIYYIAKSIGKPIPRTTAKKYWIITESPAVHWKHAKCGYLVWWQFSEFRPYGHIGIMVTNPYFWQAGSSTGFVKRKFITGMLILSL